MNNSYGHVDNRRRSICMLGSLLIHMLLFLILHLAGMGIGKTDKKDDFDLEAIKVLNMIAQAKDVMTRLPKGPPPKQKAHTGRRTPTPKARVKSVAKSRAVPQVKQVKTEIQQPKVPVHEVQRLVERQQTMAKLVIPKETEFTVNQRLLTEPKQIRYKQKEIQQEFKQHRKIQHRKREIKSITVPKQVVNKELVQKSVNFESIAKKTPVPKVVTEEPIFQQPLMPTIDETERKLERAETVAMLDITKDPRAMERKVFTDAPKKVVRLAKDVPIKEFTPTTTIKHKKRQIDKAMLKTPTQPTTSAAKPVEEVNFAPVVRRISTVPTTEPTTEKLPDITPIEDITPVQKITEKQIVASTQYLLKKNEPVVNRPQIYTPQNSSIKKQEYTMRTEKKLPVDRAAPAKKVLSSTKMEEAEINVNLPQELSTSDPLYKLAGEVDSEVKNAFLTINGVTQILTVKNGKFEVDVAMVKGINKIEVLVFSSRGGVGKNSFNLFFNPLPGAPTVKLEQPENGRQGMQEGDEVLVMGTIDGDDIEEAVLLLNGIPLPPMPVIDGVFKRKIFLPNTRITTFRVMAANKDGIAGYSPIHTVLSGYDIDLKNPRPY